MGLTDASIQIAGAASTALADTAPGNTAPTAAQVSLVSVLSPNQQTVPVNLAPANGLTAGLALGKFPASGGVSGVVTALYSTTYTEQTTNFTGSVKSSSANDAAAGTGARTIKLTYYDQTVAGPNTENLTLNGTTAVNYVQTNHCFIEKWEVLTVGSGGTNAGTLSLFTGTGGTGTTVTTIGTAVGFDGRIYHGRHYVATGKTCSIGSLVCGTTQNQGAECYLKAKDPTNANSFEEQVSDSIAVAQTSPSVLRTYYYPSIKITGPARIVQYFIPNGNTTEFFGSFEFQE